MSNLVFLNVYAPNKETEKYFFLSELKQVFKGYVDMELSNVIVAGDFNGESKWGKL